MKSSVSNKQMVDGYVVYSRKRKRPTSKSLNSEACNGKVGDHANIPQHPVEKDRCDEGGRLISCKACCNSYHPQCLSPPLEKSIPEGDWRCPNCSNNDDLSETIQNLKNKGKISSYTCFLCSKGKKVKLTEDGTFKSKSSELTSTDKPNASAESDKSEAEKQTVATVSDQAIPGNIEQHTSNNIKVDKLLMLRKNSEACIDSMVETYNQYKDTTNKQPNLVNSKEDQSKKEKCAKLCESHKLDKVALKNKGKEPLSLKNKGKEPLSFPRPVTPKQSYDHLMVEFDELVALNALTSWRGVDSSKPSCMVRISQDKITPNSSSNLKNDSASGFASRPQIIDTTRTSKRPSGFMKYKRNMDGWSELELDTLWVAVRRYGQGNWEAILADPTMYLLKNKTPQELAIRWEKETLKIFPTAVALPINTVFPSTVGRSTAPHGTSFQSTRVPSHVSGSAGIQRFPFGVVENQSLRRKSNLMPSKNNAIFGSDHNQGSSSSSALKSPSIQRNASGSLSEFLLQTINQRPNLSRMWPIGLNAVQTSAEIVSTKRQCSSSTNAEAVVSQPQLLLGGHFQLSMFVPPQVKSTAAHGIGSRSKKNPIPIQIEDCQGSSSRNTSSA